MEFLQYKVFWEEYPYSCLGHFSLNCLKLYSLLSRCFYFHFGSRDAGNKTNQHKCYCWEYHNYKHLKSISSFSRKSVRVLDFRHLTFVCLLHFSNKFLMYTIVSDQDQECNPNMCQAIRLYCVKIPSRRQSNSSSHLNHCPQVYQHPLHQHYLSWQIFIFYFIST